MAQEIISFNLLEAIKKVQELSVQNPRKFNESLDIAVVLGLDSKQSEQTVKGSVILPFGSGRKVRIIVFSADEETKKLSKESGAILAGLEDLITKIEDGFLDFDIAIATPDVMQKISKIAKKLGPRGLMPTPKNGTVTKDVKKAIEEFLKGKVGFKNEKAGIVHCLVGKMDFELDALLANIKAVVKAIKDAKPEGAKGKYIKDFYLNSTMGAAVKVNIESLN